LFAFIEGWYNLGRRHSAIGYHAPIRYETLHQQKLGWFTANEPSPNFMHTAGRFRDHG
jgi:transposase InsO family protein